MASLPDIIGALLGGGAYPEPPATAVTLQQTQMSFVLLAGDYVYKIKKPVDFGFLDYSTLEKRHELCHREVELNRRLCPDVYLGVVPVTAAGKSFRLGGDGEAVEYAVKMRCLPPEGMLDKLLAQNRVTPEMITTVAEKVAAFHEKAESNPHIIAFGDIYSITETTGENFSQTEKYIGRALSRERFDKIKAATNRFIGVSVTLLHRRQVQYHIRDCHGDMHTAHVCFTESGICIYDCIEFNERFRYIDVASEVAFLAMDLEHNGRADLADTYISAYVEKSGDEELQKLLRFYKAHRAYVRGKVACFLADDPHTGDDGRAKALAEAGKYFELAESYWA